MAKAAPPFHYQKPFPLGKEKTQYSLLTDEFVETVDFHGDSMLKVDSQALTYLAETAMREISFKLRTEHLEKVAAILDDPEATENDHTIALTLLRNAEVAAHGVLPFCQDTGTAIILGKKGQRVWTGGGDEEALSQGVYDAYTKENLRYSQVAPLSMYEEKNTGSNLPAQIDLLATDGDSYDFLFVAKGGGSANKTFLFQETKALLNPASLEKFCIEKMGTLGTSACPPYHIAIVIGGTSAETTMKTVKLASTKYYDDLPTVGNEYGQAFRDLELEAKLLDYTRCMGYGAQFGGKYFALDVRVIRLPRHGASCPVGIGVSCSADRNVKARIDKEGVWLEQLEQNPGKFVPEDAELSKPKGVVKVDLNRPMADILADLSQYPVTTPLALSGTIVVARDIAHAKLQERIDRGEGLPDYIKNHPVYYAGPAKTPAGKPSGSFGPTTAGRMDSYVAPFQAEGGSLIMLAKGNRSQQVTDACQKYGGFYLGSIGGPAALLAEQNIKKVEVLEYPELGMEAVWKIEVEDFPAYILVDDKGNDFFAGIRETCSKCAVQAFENAKGRS
ncbi:MAG: fumarate hydratase [Verrucomicrobiales bacterium]|nr:fumarate hydratase [Verrucomicrobiales bacterium]